MPKINSLASKLKGTKPPERRSGPLWQGPCDEGPLGGVTFSMLSRFLVCRERFRLYAIEGLRPVEQFNHRIEYGNMWHVCEEHHAANGDWQTALLRYTADLARRYRYQQDQVQHWYRVCLAQFPAYVEHWSKHPDVRDRTPLSQEQVFSVEYPLPSGRVVRLRGKFDSVDLIGKGKSAGIYLQENKTKGDIDVQSIRRQLSFDLQTMMYVVALNSLYDTHKVLGVRYNVVRRPLAGGKGSISQRKPNKSKPDGETEDEFYARLGELIAGARGQEWGVSDSDHYFFMRWKVELTPGDVTKFRHQCLDPLLEQLCDWYDFIRLGDVWRPSDDHRQRVPGDPPEPYGIHWRHPFGVRNVLDEGGSSDLDEYLATGSETGLRRVTTLFNELAV